MRKIIYVGGLGSNPRTVARVTESLSTYFGNNVAGFSFREAYRQGALIAQLATDSLVITHSAGMMPLRYMMPKELIAIAPPMPIPREALMLRSITKTVALLRSMRESTGRSQRVYEYNASTFIEHVVWPQYNLLHLGAVSTFDAAQTAVEMVNGNSKVTLAFMEGDLFYPDIGQHPHVDIARTHGVRICDMVIGQHDELLLYPIEVIAQIVESHK